MATVLSSSYSHPSNIKGVRLNEEDPELIKNEEGGKSKKSINEEEGSFARRGGKLLKNNKQDSSFS